MQEYVVVFPRTYESRDKLLLVLKDRPAWQRGLLNLVGGHVEQGETACEAAIRELREEAGLGVIGYAEHVGTVESDRSLIYAVEVLVGIDQKIAPRPEETEKVSWYYWDQVRQDPRLIPNLKTIIPLCLTGMRGWLVRDHGNAIGAGAYTIQVSF